jgi:hypothetical protein
VGHDGELGGGVKKFYAQHVFILGQRWGWVVWDRFMERLRTPDDPGSLHP